MSQTKSIILGNNEQQRSQLKTSLCESVQSPTNMSSNISQKNMQKISNYVQNPLSSKDDINNLHYKSAIHHPASFANSAHHAQATSLIEKYAQSEPKLSQFEQVAGGQQSITSKNQIRQFTLGNEIENQTAHFIHHQQDSLHNYELLNLHYLKNYPSSSISILQNQFTNPNSQTHLINNVEEQSKLIKQQQQQQEQQQLYQNQQQQQIQSLTESKMRNEEEKYYKLDNMNMNESMRQIILHMQDRINRLEERADRNEEKTDLNERLLQLKTQQMESSLISEVGQNIKQDVEKYVEQVIFKSQQEETDRTLNFINTLHQFQSKLNATQEQFTIFSNQIESSYKEQLSSQTMAIEKTMKLAQSNSNSLDTCQQNYHSLFSKITELNDKVLLLQQNMILYKDEINENIKQYEQFYEKIAQVQNNTTTDLKQNITPSIKALEDDLLKILQNYKDISDTIHITKYLDEEMTLIKHKIKVITQKINIDPNFQVSKSSLITYGNFQI